MPTGRIRGRGFSAWQGNPKGDPPGKIKADHFFSIPIRVEDNVVKVGDTPLPVAGRVIKTEKVSSGEVG